VLRLNPALGTLLFTVLVPGTVAGWVPVLLAGPGAAPHPLARAAGWLLISLGAALYLWCAAGFVAGQGTPAPIDAPRTLVVRGPYRYTRNPMYVAVLTAVLGQALLHRSTSVLLYAGLLWVAFELFVRGYEEPHLASRFGATYDDYRARVPRWLGTGSARRH
jgi:protein-S-isoprenylcysteine O-methyltransferase Ste14